MNLFQRHTYDLFVIYLYSPKQSNLLEKRELQYTSLPNKIMMMAKVI